MCAVFPALRRSILMLVLLLCGPLAAEPLIVGIGDGQAPPFVLRDADGQIRGGLIKELMDEFGQRLQVKIQYVSVPRKRQEAALLSGQIHVFPLANPVWFQYADQYRWSAPILKDEDIFLQHSQHRFVLQRFADLEGKRLGTLRGYHYEGLMDFFEDGTVLRDDGTNLEQNLDRLAAGRIDALIGSRIQLDYLLSHRDDADLFQQAELIASTHYRRAAFTAAPPIAIEEAYHVLQQMRLEGVIDHLLTRYR